MVAVLALFAMTEVTLVAAWALPSMFPDPS